MAAPRATRYLELLVALADHEVDFVVVGGVAAIVEGAPVTTLDLDIVFAKDEANLRRLEKVLASLHARYRDPAGRVIEPTFERLRDSVTNQLITDFGPLDALAEVGAGEGYGDLLPHVSARSLEGRKIAVLGLAKIIATKEAANRDKDRAILPILRRTLELKSRDASTH